MKFPNRLISTTILTAMLSIACNDASSPDKTDPDDTSSDKNPDSDTNSDIDSNMDTNSDDTPDAGLPEEIPNDWGFPMRVPGESDVVCYLYPEEQVDWVCTLEYESLSGVIYFQSDPVECPEDGGRPIFAVKKALISIDDEIELLSNPVYELVEHPDNSFIDFDYEGRHYRYDHSDIADYGTACHPMDCLVVSEANGGALIEDGCTEDRTLPITCVRVGSDGTLPELIDTFEGCDDYWR